MILAPTSNQGASLWVKKDNEEFLVANLTKEKPQVTINLFISLLDDVTLIAKGAGVLHITGFYEPDQGEGELPLGEDD